MKDDAERHAQEVLALGLPAGMCYVENSNFENSNIYVITLDGEQQELDIATGWIVFSGVFDTQSQAEDHLEVVLDRRDWAADWDSEPVVAHITH